MASAYRLAEQNEKKKKKKEPLDDRVRALWEVDWSWSEVAVGWPDESPILLREPATRHHHLFPSKLAACSVRMRRSRLKMMDHDNQACRKASAGACMAAHRAAAHSDHASVAVVVG